MSEKKARVKFRVDQVSNFIYGQVVGFKHVNPVISENKKKKYENNKFASDMPAATLEMQVSLDAPHYKMFEPGCEYYFEITKAKIDAKNNK